MNSSAFRAAMVTSPNGACIAYDTIGRPNQPPLILVQGLGAQLLGWHPEFCARLADAGFFVIRFDNRDVGRSQKYPAGGYGLAAMATDITWLLDGLGISAAHIVGQSLGGMVAQQFVIDHPARVGSLGLIYTTASTRHFIGGQQISDRIDQPAARSREEFVSQYQVSEAACVSPGYPQDLRWLAELGGQMYDRDHDPSGAARQLQAALASSDRSTALRSVAVPTTIFAGDSDQLIDPAGSIELAELIAGSTVTVFPGMGHELPRPLWDEFVQLLATNVHRAPSLPR